MSEYETLLTDPRDRGSDGHDRASVKLPKVGDVLIYGCHATLGGAQVRRCEADCIEELPSGLVELPDIPHDIHVAHVVAVPGIDRTAVCE